MTPSPPKLDLLPTTTTNMSLNYSNISHTDSCSWIACILKILDVDNNQIILFLATISKACSPVGSTHEIKGITAACWSFIPPPPHTHTHKKMYEAVLVMSLWLIDITHVQLHGWEHCACILTCTVGIGRDFSVAPIDMKTGDERFSS